MAFEVISAGFAAGKVGNVSKTLEKINVAGKATTAADVAKGAKIAEITNATSLSNKILDTLTPSSLKPALSEGIDNLPKMDFKPILPESGKPLQIVENGKSGSGVNISGPEKAPEIGKVDSPVLKADAEDGVVKGASGAKKSYSHLQDPPNVGKGKDFTLKQKEQIIQENIKQNKGVVKSDLSGQELVKPQKSMKGVTPSKNEWQIDHVVPKDKGGTNSYSNAQVLSREENRIKWNK